jgi:hypothetical protein
VLLTAAAAKTQEIRGFPGAAPDRVCPVTANSGLGAIFWPPVTINLYSIAAQGQSGLFLRLQIANKVFGCLSLLAGISAGKAGIAWAQLVSALFAFTISALFARPYTGYGFMQQVADCLPVFLASVFTLAVVTLVNVELQIGFLWSLITLPAVGVSVFAALTCFLHPPALEDMQGVMSGSSVKPETDKLCMLPHRQSWMAGPSPAMTRRERPCRLSTSLTPTCPQPTPRAYLLVSRYGNDLCQGQPVLPSPRRQLDNP